MTQLYEYKIYYEVDTGVAYPKDVAIVIAESEDHAVRKLKRYISNISSEHVVSKIFSVERFTDGIFSWQFARHREGDVRV